MKVKGRGIEKLKLKRECSYMRSIMESLLLPKPGKGFREQSSPPGLKPCLSEKLSTTELLGETWFVKVHHPPKPFLSHPRKTS
jgi:hypothetical protein